MNILFLSVCGMGLVFFGLFFVECHRDAIRRKSRRSSGVKISPESQVVDSPIGRHSFVHLEKQMADFLSSHQLAASRDNSALTQHSRREY